MKTFITKTQITLKIVWQSPHIISKVMFAFYTQKSLSTKDYWSIFFFFYFWAEQGMVWEVGFIYLLTYLFTIYGPHLLKTSAAEKEVNFYSQIITDSNFEGKPGIDLGRFVSLGLNHCWDHIHTAWHDISFGAIILMT